MRVTSFSAVSPNVDHQVGGWYRDGRTNLDREVTVKTEMSEEEWQLLASNRYRLVLEPVPAVKAVVKVTVAPARHEIQLLAKPEITDAEFEEVSHG